jgi:APA family basic amino acid/polyamine antiporter
MGSGLTPAYRTSPRRPDLRGAGQERGRSRPSHGVATLAHSGVAALPDVRPCASLLRTDAPTTTSAPDGPGLARRLGAFDATMIVMGGIVGAGIFMNPSVVARRLPTGDLILLAWGIGGLVALLGAFIWAELAVRRPVVGGQYAYIRDAFHPMAAFLYGWALLLVTQTGGMAAVAVTFAVYFRELTGLVAPGGATAAAALLVLTAVNCLGVRAGASVQNAFMVLKVAAVAALIGAGLLAPLRSAPPRAEPAALSAGILPMMGAALVPVLFAYGGWQTASFLSGELRRPRRDLPRGLIFGIAGVVALYIAVNFVCLRALSPAGLAATSIPASEVMRRALGPRGGRLIAAGIAISTLGFLSQGILTAPRVYYAMARDGVFFRAVGRLSPRTRIPVVAIVLQGLVASLIALSGTYEQILTYDISVDFIFYGLTGAALLVLRRREGPASAFRMPGGAPATILFVAICWLVVASAVAHSPANAAVGLALLAAGVPAYAFWARRGRA